MDNNKNTIDEIIKHDPFDLDWLLNSFETNSNSNSVQQESFIDKLNETPFDLSGDPFANESISNKIIVNNKNIEDLKDLDFKYLNEDVIKNIYDFLTAFKGEGKRCYFRYILEGNEKVAKNEDCLLKIDDEDEFPNIIGQMRRLQKKGYGIYFVVNSGGHKKEFISSITAQFMDFDLRKIFERDTNGNIVKGNDGKNKVARYRNDEEVNELKSKIKVLLSEFLEPSFIVDTKNGLHVYWLLKKGQKKERFTYIQEQLISYFQQRLNISDTIDTGIIDLPRVLRVPYLYHLKDKNNPYLVQIAKSSNNKYSHNDICKALKIDTKTIEIIEAEMNNVSGLISSSKSKSTKKTATKLNPKEQQIREINDIPAIIVQKDDKEQIFCDNYADLLDLVRHLDMKVFLEHYYPQLKGIEDNQNFNCVFHKDTNASACISNENGVYKYFCNSDNCGMYHKKGKDLIDLAEKMFTAFNLQQRNVVIYNQRGALEKFVLPIYNITYSLSPWIKNEMARINESISVFEDNRLRTMIEEKYPQFFKLMERCSCLGILKKILLISSINVRSEIFQFKGKNVFFYSNRKLKESLERDLKEHGINQELSLENINKSVNLFALLGFIRKVNENVVNPLMLAKAKAIQGKNKYENAICFYISENVMDILPFAENMAKVLLDKKFYLKHMGKTYIQNVFGDIEANRVYGQTLTNQEIKRLKIETYIELACVNELIMNKYFTIDSILEYEITDNVKGSGKNKVTTYISKDTMKKIFYEIIPEIELRQNINKDMACNVKDKFNLNCHVQKLVYFR